MDRWLAPLLVVLLVTPAPQAGAQATDRPSLEMPDGLRDLQRDWTDAAFADVNETIETTNLTDREENRLRTIMEQVRNHREDHRHQAVLAGLTNLRVTATYLEARQEAEEQNVTKPVFLNHTQPAFREASNLTGEVMEDINTTQRELETARGLETLYLAAEATVQGNNQLGLHPRYRSFMEASGNETHPNILQLTVQTSVGAKWSLKYAADLHDHSLSVDEAGDGPGLNQSRIPAALDFLQKEADERRPSGESNRNLETLRQRMNATEERGNHLLAMALGGTLLASYIQTNVRKQVEEGNLEKDQVRAILEDHGSNYTALETTLDDGFRGILLKDGHKTVDDILDRRNASVGGLASGVAVLDKAKIFYRAVGPLAVESTSTSEEAGVTGTDVLVAVGGGVALGAGVAALLRRRR